MRQLVLAIILVTMTQMALANVTPSALDSYAATLDDENHRFLKQLVAKVRSAGFRDAQVVPQIFSSRLRTGWANRSRYSSIPIPIKPLKLAGCRLS
jgi:hypothetical protein